MGRRRERAKQETPRRDAPRATTRMQVSVVAIAVAWLFILATALVVYPAGTAQYWIKSAVFFAAGSILVAILPVGAVRDMPAQLGAALRRPPPVLFAVMVAAVTAVLSLVFAVYLFELAPTTSDEIAQLWHAKMLVHGRLSLPADPNPEFFAMDNIISTPRWYSQYPIGGPAVLALGVVLGVPWLVNPALAALAAVAMYHFGRRAFGETQGRAIAALFSLTPMVLMMSGSYMNHVPVLFLAACTLAALVEWERATTPRRAMTFAALVGAAIGAMATIRPLDAAVVAIVVGVFQLTIVARDKTRMRELAVQVAAGTIAVAPLFIANWATTGSPLQFGYEALWGAGHQLGFHVDPRGEMHTLGRGFFYAVTYVSQLNEYVMLWPVPALLVACAGLFTMARSTRWDALLFGLFWAHVMAYAAYWYQGQFLGPRFMFTALPTVIVLLARTPFLVGQRFPGVPRRATLVFSLACVVVSWTVAASRFSVWGVAEGVRNSRLVFKVHASDAARAADLHNALVFVREPFGSQLQHRMWGVGMSRSDAAQLLATSDACSILSALHAVEDDSTIPHEKKADAVARAAVPFAPADLVRTADPTVHISSMTTLTVPCEKELVGDSKLGVATFGSVLPLEPIDSNGRVEGDVIYVMDLGDRNEVLRARFGDRRWYRLSVMRPGQAPKPVLTPY